ncbi:helix-turn-helix domain-containing protein [Pseudohalioglobus lutimaris]|uniref:helix-turn-helix domain-containing protein n=1 Tax=Pseudohalioglobus lutimaris TaxID=1737061 RepID=UPI0013FD815C|nr:helix-turn-helix domain-containing protein [Pseudohalioglobus lutimaris]
MTVDTPLQVDAFVTPGTMLRSARLQTELSEREVEDLLNLMPGYVGILERDDYQALRSPAFARGYVRAYGQLMKLEETELLRAFDEQREHWEKEKKRVETRPLQLQRTGTGVVIGLVILLAMVFALWFWQGQDEVIPASVQPNEVQAPTAEAPQVNYED